MAGLSVTEKTFWKERIAARIARRIEAIRRSTRRCSTGSSARRTPRRWSRSAWRQSYAELEQVRVEEAALARRRKDAQRAMLAALRGVPPGEVTDGYGVPYGSELPVPHEAAQALARRQAAHQERLLGDDPVGREIARLEVERDGLLDVVWLACSPAQIKQLWSKVGDLLGDEPTRLWSARRWRSPRARRRDGPSLPQVGGAAGPAAGRLIVIAGPAGCPGAHGFTGPWLGPAYRVLLPALRGRQKRLFFNELAGSLVLPGALGGAVLGYQVLGVLGLILGLGAGLVAGCSVAEKARFHRP